MSGAVESILPYCTHFLAGNGMTTPLKQHDRERISQQAHIWLLPLIHIR